MNHTNLVGNLTDDVTVNKTPKGTHVTNVTLAIDRPFKSKQKADFPRVVVWGKNADILKKYEGHKGDQIGIDGRIQTGSYQNQDGKTVYTTEVVADRDGLHLMNHKGKPSDESDKSDDKSDKDSDNKNKNKDTKDKKDDGSDNPDFKRLGISDDDLPF